MILTPTGCRVIERRDAGRPEHYRAGGGWIWAAVCPRRTVHGAGAHADADPHGADRHPGAVCWTCLSPGLGPFFSSRLPNLDPILLACALVQMSICPLMVTA